MDDDKTPSPLDPEKRTPFTIDDDIDSIDESLLEELVPPSELPSLYDLEPPIVNEIESSSLDSSEAESDFKIATSDEPQVSFSQIYSQLNLRSVAILGTLIIGIVLAITIPKAINNGAEGDQLASDGSTENETSSNELEIRLEDEKNTSVDLFNSPSNFGQLKDLLEKGIAEIFCQDYGGTGWGFSVDNKILLVTNYHVIEDCITNSVEPKFFLNSDTSDALNARILGIDPEKDLALLDISERGSGSLKPLQISTQYEATHWVLTVGFPESPDGFYQDSRTWEPTWSSGRVQRAGVTESFDFDGYIPGSMDVIYFDAAINNGNSGGPLLNAAGQVIGIISGAYENKEGYNFAIEVSEFCNQLMNCQTDPWSLR